MKIGASYGSNMIKVLAALEAYWENRNNTHIFQEQLLYNLWKVSNNWLELKNSKAQKDGASELLLRRKQEVEVLRDEALAKLEEVSPRVADAFQRYQVRKQHGTVAQPLKGLGNGYHLEREHYLHGQKTSGATISGSKVDFLLRFEKNTKAQRFVQKGFGNLSLKDTQVLQQLFPNMQPVVYMNKIARLKHMVQIIDGKICDSEGPILMTGRLSGLLVLDLYVVDKYGNLYKTSEWNSTHKYIEQDRNGNYREAKTTQFNHSSLLAGADVLCAGALHIGWDNRHQLPTAGVLSAIDNISGHYKPSTENLRNCLEVFQGLGINIDLTRVTDFSSGEGVVYWGRDFMANRRHPWADFQTAPNSFFKAPPITPGL